MEALITLLIIVFVYINIYKFAVILLNRTGLPRDVAGFEVVSALTTTGFTTSMSEYVVSHPLRRRVAQVLMIIGSTGITGGIASLVLAFLGQTLVGALLRLAILVLGIAILYFYATSERVDRVVGGALARLVDRIAGPRLVNYEALTGVGHGYIVATFRVSSESWLAGRTIRDAGLAEEGVVVLGIYRRHGLSPHATYIPSPSPDQTIIDGDELVVYGREDVIASLSRRRRGPEGDREHNLIVEARKSGAQAGVAHPGPG